MESKTEEKCPCVSVEYIDGLKQVVTEYVDNAITKIAEAGVFLKNGPKGTVIPDPKAMKDFTEAMEVIKYRYHKIIDCLPKCKP